MEPTRLFLETLRDLQSKVAAGDDYSMLRASALLRQLLLDGTPLIHRVNRDIHVKIRFPVCGRAYREAVLNHKPIFYSALSGIHTSGALSHSCEMISLDAFLGTVVLVLSGQILTVHDLISISANVLGGVHKGDPEDVKAQAVSAFSQHFRVAGGSLTAAQLKPVVLVAIDGLQPLAAALTKGQAPPRAV